MYEMTICYTINIGGVTENGEISYLSIPNFYTAEDLMEDFRQNNPTKKILSVNVYYMGDDKNAGRF